MGSDNVGHTYHGTLFSTINRDVLWSVAVEVNLDRIMQSEVTQRQKRERVASPVYATEKSGTRGSRAKNHGGNKADVCCRSGCGERGGERVRANRTKS